MDPLATHSTIVILANNSQRTVQCIARLLHFQRSSIIIPTRILTSHKPDLVTIPQRILTSHKLDLVIIPPQILTSHKLNLVVIPMGILSSHKQDLVIIPLLHVTMIIEGSGTSLRPSPLLMRLKPIFSTISIEAQNL